MFKLIVLTILVLVLFLVAILFLRAAVRYFSKEERKKRGIVSVVKSLKSEYL